MRDGQNEGKKFSYWGTNREREGRSVKLVLHSIKQLWKNDRNNFITGILMVSNVIRGDG